MHFDIGSHLVRCENCRDMLKALVRIHHQNIDPPTRSIESDEPVWVCRLRKVCLHVMALDAWELDIEAVHAMATEIRAAYLQIHAVWKCIPEEYRIDEIDGDWWANEARNGMLATYDHPTGFSLCNPGHAGGFGSEGEELTYLRLSRWLGQLGVGYGLALNYLAEFLDATGDIESLVGEALQMASRGEHE